MHHSMTPEDQLRRRRILVIAATAIALLITAVIYAALSRPGVPQASDATVSQVNHVDLYRAPETAGSALAVDGGLAALEPTADPKAFAVLVAHALFNWDTTVAVPLAAYTNRLVDVADPTGESSPGLVADTAGYLPTAAAWADLRVYSTRQWLKVESVKVPGLWSRAKAEAGPDGLLPGTAAYTMVGVRHRAGIWEDKPVASAHDVAFTVFIVCAPSYRDCRLLRLSRLDEPLG